MSDVDRYPHVLDGTVWHQRPTTDTGDGPTYPTRCGKQVKTFTVDEPGGQPEEWQSRCEECYR